MVPPSEERRSPETASFTLLRVTYQVLTSEARGHSCGAVTQKPTFGRRPTCTHDCRVEPGKVHPPRNVVLNPMWIPPFLRIDLDAVELHREMNVVAPGHAGLATQAHHLALLHRIAVMDINSAEMAIDRL